MTKDPLHENLLDEQASLEAVCAAFDGAASLEEKLDAVRRLLDARLAAIRAKLRTEGEKIAQPTVTEGIRSAVKTSPIQLVGCSAAMKQIEEAIHRVAHSNATVLIRGESGTGKELIARAIHSESLQAAGAFIPLHCAAVADTLLESELFGHERGAFTGAHEQRKGKFELADGGTLFLDEIGDIPATTQVKLLRVLQEKCVERVGGSRSVPVNVRVISATHRDLEAMVASGTFREDLYYRLNVVPIALPPLRQREGDIPLLIGYFLTQFNRQNRRRIRLSEDLLRLMGRYHWPGNVRELQNCVERLVVMADPGREIVSLETVPVSLRGYFADMKQVTTAGVTKSASPDGERRMPFGTSLQDIERARLLDALQRTGWNQAKTARLLGLTARQVGYKVKKYGIEEGRDD
ncbi:MAG TPA: sigma 54-interacting transcriptional regulator [Nitrospiraceae bacterium]|nr:sigma 54-interacting transcriptional regulator [Nitrospiraceae bacterium]